MQVSGSYWLQIWSSKLRSLSNIFQHCIYCSLHCTCAFHEGVLRLLLCEYTYRFFLVKQMLWNISWIRQSIFLCCLFHCTWCLLYNCAMALCSHKKSWTFKRFNCRTLASYSSFTDLQSSAAVKVYRRKVLCDIIIPPPPGIILFYLQKSAKTLQNLQTENKFLRGCPRAQPWLTVNHS